MTSVAPLSAPGQFVQLGAMRVHYLDFAGDGPPIVLLHGLSANSSAFGGLIGAGLSPAFRVIAPDLRGRGWTDKPPTGYTMADHAADVLALLDHLDLERVVLGGHSFGGFLAIYLAANHPHRFTKLVVIDSAITLSPNVGEMLRPSLERLGKVFASEALYLAEMRAAPTVHAAWDDRLEAYYRAELQRNADGTAQSLTSGASIAQAMQQSAQEPWRDLVARVPHQVLLLNALGAYGPPGAPPLITELQARETAALFRHGRYAAVPGNHVTMVFGAGADAVRNEIEHFVRQGES